MADRSRTLKFWRIALAGRIRDLSTDDLKALIADLDGLPWLVGDEVKAINKAKRELKKRERRTRDGN